MLTFAALLSSIRRQGRNASLWGVELVYSLATVNPASEVIMATSYESHGARGFHDLIGLGGRRIETALHHYVG